MLRSPAQLLDVRLSTLLQFDKLTALLRPLGVSRQFAKARGTWLTPPTSPKGAKTVLSLIVFAVVLMRAAKDLEAPKETDPVAETEFGADDVPLSRALADIVRGNGRRTIPLSKLASPEKPKAPISVARSLQQLAPLSRRTPLVLPVTATKAIEPKAIEPTAKAQSETEPPLSPEESTKAAKPDLFSFAYTTPSSTALAASAVQASPPAVLARKSVFDAPVFSRPVQMTYGRRAPMAVLPTTAPVGTAASPSRVPVSPIVAAFANANSPASTSVVSSPLAVVKGAVRGVQRMLPAILKGATASSDALSELEPVSNGYLSLSLYLSSRHIDRFTTKCPDESWEHVLSELGDSTACAYSNGTEHHPCRGRASAGQRAGKAS